MKLLTLIIAFALSLCTYSQNLTKIHNVANLVAANTISNPEKGQMVYLDSAQNIYYYDGLSWVAIEGLVTGSVCAFSTQNGITSNAATGNLETDDFVFGRSTLDYVSPDFFTESVFFFDKSKGAFRAGFIQTHNWNDENRGVGSVAFGTDNRASGMGSVSFGNLNMSTGIASFTAGEGSVASNTASIAMGQNVTAEAPGQVTIGHGNTPGVSTASPSDPFPATDRLFVIGNNSNITPSNSLTMLNNGNTIVTGTWTGPSFVTTSDRRLKKDIKDLELGMDFLKKIETKSYTLKNSTDKDRIHYGVIAQDLQKINPNLVYKEESETENLSVNYTEMIPILINAIIELDEEIELLKQSK